jgi:hypothetical protein
MITPKAKSNLEEQQRQIIKKLKSIGIHMDKGIRYPKKGDKYFSAAGPWEENRGKGK